MSRSVEIFQVDAFTIEKFAGNPAGVVLGAQVLSESEMRGIAGELGRGDTAFVFAPTDGSHDLNIRFFTPRNEAGFVGHATLATHAVLNELDPKPLRRQRGKTGIVEVRRRGNGMLAITQPAPAAGKPLGNAELDAVLSLCGLNRHQLDNQCPPQIMGSGSTRLLLGVNSSADLDALAPQLEALGNLSPQIGAQGYFVFTRNPSAQHCDTEARMFCPALGIDEDPVSGNAHGMLGVYLQTQGLLPSADGIANFVGSQGRHVGRAGRVEIELQRADTGSGATTVTIAGAAVVVFRAQLQM
jgi:PhzF family phenazine biosynthesis protein